MAYNKNPENRRKSVWRAMMSRCYNTKNAGYSGYGGRGIMVEREWHDYSNFRAWVLSRESSDLSIERIDNSGNYGPDNCRMATKKEQALNRRSNTAITIHGKTQTLSQWIEELGLKSSTVKQRYYVYKWPILRSLGLRG